MSMIGHNRFVPFVPPVNDESVQVIVSPARPMLMCLAEFPAKYYHLQLQSKYECCRDPENVTLEIRKTKAEIDKADLYVFQCGCGRKHRRFKVDPGAVAMFGQEAKLGEVNGNIQ